MNGLDRNYFVTNDAQVSKLRDQFSDFQENKTKPTTVIHNNKKYTLVASFTETPDTIDLIKNTLLNVATFGMCSETCAEGAGKISIYLEDASKTESVSKKTLATEKNPTIERVNVIGNEAPWNAFTDLASYKGNLLCSFRKSVDQQVGDNGTIGIVASKNNIEWSQVANITLKGYDLRDPKLSVTPDGRLMLNMGATLWSAVGQETLNSAVSFSDDGINWSPVQLISNPGSWIWRVTWNEGIAYGTNYTFDQATGTSTLSLVTSTDGINYSPLVNLNIPGNPTEATVRFLSDNTMVALVRRNDGTGLIGTSKPPYQQDWTWSDTGAELGGPDFLVLSDDTMWASSRAVNGSSQTCVLAAMTTSSYKPVLTLPSSGDCGYTGMVFENNKLNVSYYASQSGKSLVYRAIINLPK